MENIWNAIIEITRSGIKVFFPMHPRTKKALEKFDLLEMEIPDNLLIGEPISYREAIALESNARLIITDSGGVQKEGYFFKTPCVIPRNETEWVELVERGVNTIAGNERENIYQTYRTMTGKKIDFDPELYGNGKASQKIVEILAMLIS